MCSINDRIVYNYPGSDTDEQYYYGTQGSQFELRRDELMKVMKDTSLSYEVKAEKMEDIRLKYRCMNTSKEAEDADSVAPGLTLSESTSSSSGSDVTLDDQRRAELQSILRDKSLSKDERRLKMKDVKKKYSAMTSIEDELAAFCKTKKKNKGSAKLASTVLKSFSLGNEKKAAEAYTTNRGKTAATVDTTRFALAENHLYGVYKNKKKAVRSEYAGRF